MSDGTLLPFPGDASALPWAALGHTEGEPPWEALEQLSAALAADDSLLDRLWQVYEPFTMDPYGTDTYECIYVPAVIAMAAPRLSEAGRGRAADLLVAELVAAGEDDDEAMLDVLQCACGALGAAAVPAVMGAIEEELTLDGAWFHLWDLMVLAGESSDPQLRCDAAELCRRTLRRARSGDLTADAVSSAAWALARLDHRPEDRSLVAELASGAQFGDIQEAIKVMDGEPLDWDPYEQPWTTPVRQWVEQYWEELHQWYAEGRQDPEDSDDGVDDEYDYDGGSERQASRASNRFAASATVAALPQEVQEHAEGVAWNIAHLALSYEGTPLERLNTHVLREVLLELFPRRVSAGPEFFVQVAPAARAFLEWLQAEGILKEAAPLVRAVDGWADRIVAHAADRSRWGMAKGLCMLAMEAGVDMSDREAMDGFLEMFQRQQRAAMAESQVDLGLDDRTVEAGYEEEPGDELVEPGETIVNRGPKTGRNDPCPCGSGKKYKKCCGR